MRDIYQKASLKFAQNRVRNLRIILISLHFAMCATAFALAYDMAQFAASVPMSGPANAVATIADVRFASAASAMWMACVVVAFAGVGAFTFGIAEAIKLAIGSATKNEA